MKTTLLQSLIIFLFLSIILPSNLSIASSDKHYSDFKFYGIGATDTLTTVKEKLNANNFPWARGKAVYLGMNRVQKNRISQKTTKNLEMTMAMDSDLKDFGEGLAYEDMPIDTIDSGFPEDSPFNSVSYFFSSFNHKILLIEIMIAKSDVIKEKLSSKIGSCIMDGYCENENSILIVTQNSGWNLHVYFFENLKPHYEKIKKLKAVKDKKIKSDIDEAF